MTLETDGVGGGGISRQGRDSESCGLVWTHVRGPVERGGICFILLNLRGVFELGLAF